MYREVQLANLYRQKMKMTDEIFNLFTILRPKKQKYSSSSKMAAVKWVLKIDKIKSFHAIVFVQFENRV